MENKESFNYTYSAKEQEAIKAIRRKYSAPEQTEDKMAQLLRLDASVTRKATIFSLVFGIIGALIMGMGMSLAMTDIGSVIGLDGGMELIAGVPMGIFGIVLVCAAYPIYNSIMRRERERVASEIIRLTDELLR